ncbi:type II secretion system major pseudopilin GspG [Candidatus Sumerlaeota bacterium]|nr:type II secretion system major pseudopilin GspG [Candidatus Sumerlaeota bacterium]
MKRFRSHKKGFTFLEIMFVVVIIGILMGIAVPQFTGKAKKARIMSTKANMNTIGTALSQYEMNVGAFPSSEQGLAALVKCPSDVPEEDWDSAYLKEIPKDAWKEDFIYKFPGEHNQEYDLYSKGPDRQEDTEDDIKNWKEEEDAL